MVCLSYLQVHPYSTERKQIMAKQASARGLKWYQDARFGMFIHWGLYSILARQEWVMHNEHIPVPEYEQLVQQFNPTKFNADEWVELLHQLLVLRSEEHTSELQSHSDLVCRLLLEKKKS